MNWTLIGLVVMVVAILLAPFLALRAVSVWRARRLPPPLPPESEKDDAGGSW